CAATKKAKLFQGLIDPRQNETRNHSEGSLIMERRSFLKNAGIGAVSGSLAVAAAAAAPAAAAANAGAAGASKAVTLTPPPATSYKPDEIAKLPRVKVDLVAPPFVHEHEQIASGGPKIVEFRMVIEEKEMVIDDKGTTIWAQTFNGSMPGPTMVVHQNDYVELTLVNPSTSVMPHNIDFHGSTGALGGAALTNVNPGEEVVLRFKADRCGAFIFHCAPEGMVAWHVVTGMSGTLLVLPRDGLKDAYGNTLKYDRIYTIGENDLYIPKDENGKYKKYGSLAESYGDTREAMRGPIPSHVVFNGNDGALTGEGALTTKVRETVQIGHCKCNRDKRSHLDSGYSDGFWPLGKFSNTPLRDIETWFIPGGASA